MYWQEMSPRNPACFLFVLDQSCSMEEPLGGSKSRKCDQLADVMNGWLTNMLIMCSGPNGVKDYLHVGVIGYHTDNQGNPMIETPLKGPLSEQAVVPISQFDAHPLRVEEKMQQVWDEDLGEMAQFPVAVPIWVDPVCEGGTPMCEMLQHAYQVLEQWIKQHPDCFPPILLHITDGESQDGDPIPYAESIKSLATTDGNVLFFNCHLSRTDAEPFVYPHCTDVLPDYLARTLFDMSSVLPECLFERAVRCGYVLQNNARGMVFNADIISLLHFLDIGGSRPVRLR